MIYLKIVFIFQMIPLHHRDVIRDGGVITGKIAYSLLMAEGQLLE